MGQKQLPSAGEGKGKEDWGVARGVLSGSEAFQLPTQERAGERIAPSHCPLVLLIGSNRLGVRLEALWGRDYFIVLRLSSA